MITRSSSSYINNNIIKVAQQEWRLAHMHIHMQRFNNLRTQLVGWNAVLHTISANEAKTQAADARTNNEPRRAA